MRDGSVGGHENGRMVRCEDEGRLGWDEGRIKFLQSA
jgi:hypothetical protein